MERLVDRPLSQFGVRTGGNGKLRRDPRAHLATLCFAHRRRVSRLRASRSRLLPPSIFRIVARCTRRSLTAAAAEALGNTSDHRENGRLIVTMRLRCS
jgi:hypothetical protein